VKLIAHRGWSQGADENTLAAFARAAAGRVFGVEFDVRRARGSGTLVVSHDPPRSDAPILELEAVLAVLAGTDLELFVEAKEAGIADAVIARLTAAGLAERSVLFGFADVARSFPWSGVRPVRLGVILPYPWFMNRFMTRYDPDVVLLGWDERPWTRLAFRAWRSIFPISRLTQRYDKPFIAGVAQRADDLRWLSEQGVYAAVADMDDVWGCNRTPARALSAGSLAPEP
jgi:glycerophosphoryl diester phosphodiesterase